MPGSFMSGVRWAMACIGTLLAMLLFKSWFRARRSGQDTVHHALRLADDIAGVAETIEADLGKLEGHASVNALRARCREGRERADHTFAQRKGLRRLPRDLVEDLVERLHDDHRRIVNLRSEVDSALSGAKGNPRAYKFVRSRFPSSSFPTRPSAL